MPEFIFDRLGNPVGYINGIYIHTLHGEAIGQIRESHVHKLSGEYVGELYNRMVVDKKIGDFGNIGHPGDPGNPGFYGIPKNRGAVEIEFTEVFQKLLDRVNSTESIEYYKNLIA